VLTQAHGGALWQARCGTLAREGTDQLRISQSRTQLDELTTTAAAIARRTPYTYLQYLWHCNPLLCTSLHCFALRCCCLQVYTEFPSTYSEAFTSSPPRLPNDFSTTHRSLKMVAECPLPCEQQQRQRQRQQQQGLC
jgi:hypothetical protein